MIRSISSILVVTFSAWAMNALGAEQCPAINCDCSSLVNEKWVQVCQSHETRIKKACVDNANTPKDYCAVHGLKARPLPLAMVLSVPKLDKTVQLSELTDKVAALYWAIHADSLAAVKAYEEQNYPRTVQILQLVDANIDNLFEYQQKLDKYHRAAGEQKAAGEVWQKASAETLAFSEKLEKFGLTLSAGIDDADTAKLKKIHSVLAQKALRMAGKGFEQSGYAFGQTARHDKAAAAWREGADIAVKLSELERASGVAPSSIKFTEFMAASRLHRASYHWMQDKEFDNSLNGLRESQQFVDREVQQNIEVLVNTVQDSASGGVLTGR